ncbi:GspH/FimT family pseudopilin [Rheinheimera sediminis]|uniref:GspH/FimT family pseudopilin n=1 Tax=Rheinheimera sp. YQF-1 TaxID=2499626 RepID=UPI00164712EB|nr:GspH/FimT family protein [Rheinheimera sp. YQF-1]
MVRHNRLSTIPSAFSLLELLLVLAIVGIVSATALPDLRQVWQRFQAEHFMRQLSQHLAYARVHAITHQKQVQICPRYGLLCNSDWNSTAIQLHQRALNSGQDVLLRELRHPIDSHQLFYNRPSLQFRRDGSLDFLESGTFVYCSKESYHWHYRLSISQAGRSRLWQENTPCPYQKVQQTESGSLVF